MKNIEKVVEVKNAGKWIMSHIVTDELEIYKSLSADLIAKKLNNCSYIKTVKRVCNYDGTQNITVTYNNDCRAIYTVKN